jgi:hypothetical protein
MQQALQPFVLRLEKYGRRRAVHVSLFSKHDFRRMRYPVHIIVYMKP